MPRHYQIASFPLRPQISRSGSAATLVLVILAIAVVLISVVLFLWISRESQSANQPLVYSVERKPFLHVVVERGEVESSNNVEVRCMAKMGKGQQLTILKVVPEGTRVQEGDVLVQLDSSALEVDRVEQRIAVAKAEASVVKARNTFEAAEIAKTEYLEGKFKEQEETLTGEVFVAEENLRRAEQYARYSERLAAKGYVTELQLVGDRFAVEKSKKDLAAAETKLMVLRKYSKEKELKTLESDIASARANWFAEKSAYELELAQLEDIEERIAACTIVAPAPGQVVHANRYSSRGGSEFVVEEGEQVREGQVIIRLPDPDKMQVKAKVNEARIERIREGMPAIIRVDAFPDAELKGVVTKVSEYPEPSSWWASHIREYATFVNILETPEDLTLKPGLTSEVSIQVEHAADVLQVPVQAVYEHGDKTYCFEQAEKGWVPREVAVGSTNDEFVVIQSGLTERANVSLTPRQILASVELPEIQEVQIEPAVASPSDLAARNVGGDIPAEGAGGRSPAGAGGDRGAKGGEQGRAQPAGGEQGGRPGGAAGTPGGGMSASQIAEMMFTRMDVDKDGRLAQDEIPEDRRDRIMKADTNSDGAIDRTELASAMKNMMQGQQSQP